jgi:hypothetical protein
MSNVYRSGNRNARNIYKHNFARDEETHVGVMFTPEDGRLAVEALNLAHDTKNATAPLQQFKIHAYGPRHAGGVIADKEKEHHQVFSVYASDEMTAAQQFHARNLRHVIVEMWRLVPPSYLGAEVLTPDRDECATPDKVNLDKEYMF